MNRAIIILTLLCSLFSVFHRASAQSINLPVCKSTQYWNVTLDNPTAHGENNHPKKDLINEYRLTIKPLKKGLREVKIDVFRDEKDSDKFYGLFSKDYTPNQHPFVFENLPVSKNADILIVDITWKEEPNGRNFKQAVFFRLQ